MPTYPRHPLVMAQQALALHDLPSGRLRLGIGPSHRFIIDNMYGLQHSKPLTHLREYRKCCFTVLWTGKVNHRGQVRKWQSVKRGFLMRQIMHWSTDDDLRKLPRFRSLVNDIKLILRPMCYLSSHKNCPVVKMAKMKLPWSRVNILLLFSSAL